jgi:membrane protease subunit (stomatin/prohibitin family)
MGIMGFIKKQFIDVIEWTESGDGTLSFKYPMAGNEIQNGAKLTVRESQMAMFVNEGRIADIFKPGLYTLNTSTLPVLTNLMNWDKLFQSPFKSDVYFFSTREQIDQKWGTPQPITIRDKEMGGIRLRAFGSYSYKIRDPKLFYQKISGTRENYRVEELDGQLVSAIVNSLATFFGSSQVAFMDMASNQQQFSDTLKKAVAANFTTYGLEVSSFFVQSISLPEELQAYFDKAASMRMVGDLARYTQFQAADAIKDAAQNSGGAAGAGVGIGAGIGLGGMMAGAMGMGMGGQGPNAPKEEDPLALIDKMHELLKKGILSQEEFNAKKAELLKRVK